MHNVYKRDLAYIHDDGFTDFIKDAAPGLLQILRHSGKTKGLVVDLGCGSGIWARQLTLAKYKVLGVDISDAMIRLARKRAPKATFVTGSFLTMKLPPCVAVTALGEVVNYLFDPRNTQTEIGNFFRRVYETLRPGGVFVFDVAGPGRGGPEGVRRSFSTGRDWAILFRAEEDRKRGLLIRHMVTFRKVGKHYQRGEETHRLRLYSRPEVEKLLLGAGFQVRAVRGYGQTPFGPGVVGFVTRKR
jgi:SAM-dependent methyltransferase